MSPSPQPIASVNAWASSTSRTLWWAPTRIARRGGQRPPGSCHGRRIQPATTAMFLSPATSRISPGSLVTTVIWPWGADWITVPRCESAMETPVRSRISAAVLALAVSSGLSAIRSRFVKITLEMPGSQRALTRTAVVPHHPHRRRRGGHGSPRPGRWLTSTHRSMVRSSILRSWMIHLKGRLSSRGTSSAGRPNGRG